MDINIRITFGEKELKYFGGLVEAMATLAEAQKAETTKETAPTAEQRFCVEMKAQADEEYKNRLNNWREWKGNA